MRININAQNEKLMNTNIWENISRIVFGIFIFLLPLWVLPTTAYPLEINKVYLTFVFSSIAAVLWLIGFIQTGEIKIPKSLLLLAMIIISAVWLIASVFSDNRVFSLIGDGFRLDSASSMFALTFLAIIIIILFQNKKQSLRLFEMLLFSSILVFIFQFFHSILDFKIFQFSFLPARTSNILGSWSELGAFFGLTALISLIFLKTYKERGVFFGIVLTLSLLGMAFVNFNTAWIMLGIFSIVFLIYIFSNSSFTDNRLNYEKQNRLVAGLPVMIFIISLLFIFSQPLIGGLLASYNLNFIEVRPSWSSTFDIIKSSLKENPVLGSGPGAFVYNWLTFKSQEINMTPFWNTRFSYGIGLIPSLFVSAGILGILAWLFFLIIFLLQIFKVISADNANSSIDGGNNDELSKSLLLVSFLASLYLWIFNFVYSSSFIFFALAFIFTGLFISQIASQNKIKVWKINIFGSPKIKFVASLSVLVVIIGIVGMFYIFSEKYAASYYFAEGIKNFNKNGDINTAENYFMKAVNLDKQDKYYRGLTEIGILKLNRIINDTSISPDELRQEFQAVLSNTIQFAQLSVNLNPSDSFNWLDLAKIYETVVPLKIEGAENLALNSYDEAIKRDPLNPENLLLKARLLIQNNNLEDAKISLQKAVNLKKDYAASNFLLAQVEAQTGNIKEAINKTKDAQFLAPNDIGILFQLGLLYYQDKDFENSKLVFEKTVLLNDNYSNARYFLGLIYDNQNEKQKAIEQFEKIDVLNPDNEEVKNILANLKNGKKALSEITPPAKAPEKRENPPIEPKKQEGELKR